jgi:hypothetical protein
MTLEEEKNYWKELVEQMAGSMDKTAMELYKWQEIAARLVEHINPYLDWPEDPKMLATYATLKDYYYLKNNVKKSCNDQQLELI